MASNFLKCNSCDIVINELLAFVQNQVDIMNEDSIIRLCLTAFSSEDVCAAKDLLFQSVKTTEKKVKRKGKNDGKSQRNMEDIISLMKCSSAEIVPIFVARELRKLPPVTFDHIDVTRLLRDIIILKDQVTVIQEQYATVDQINKLETEILNLKKLSKDKEIQTINTVDITSVNANTTEHCNSEYTKAREHTAVSTNVISQEADACIQSMENIMEHVNTGSTMNNIKQNILTQSNTDTNKEHDNKWITVQRKSIKNKFMELHGHSNDPTGKFKAADIKIPLFINNVDKNTSISDISNYIFSKTRVTVHLVEIKMKQQRDYKAYKVFVPRHKITMFLDGNIWPEGILFRRFIHFKERKMHDSYSNGVSDVSIQNKISS